jgi:hypothetical protein
MPPTAPFLEFAVAWSDEDLQELVVTASSGLFSGQVNLYGGPNELERIAKLLQGFPVSSTDRREINLGQDDLSGYGTVKLSVYCTDSTGHLVIEVTMRSFPASLSKRQESAVVVVPAVVGDLDRFAIELRGANNQTGARAALRSAA